jgi:hypothetical protein
MPFPTDLWQKVLRHVRQMLWSVYHAESLPISEEVSSLLNVRHCGIFLNVENPEAYKSDRAGMLYADRTDGMASLLLIAKELHGALVKKGTTFEKLQTLKMWLTIVYGITPLRNAMEWDINRDGIYFQWGDKYRAFYLPHEMQGLRQQDALDRLCAWEAGVPSSLWQLPEGLVLKMTCDFGTG